MKKVSFTLRYAPVPSLSFDLSCSESAPPHARLLSLSTVVVVQANKRRRPVLLVLLMLYTFLLIVVRIGSYFLSLMTASLITPENVAYRNVWM